MVVSLLHKMQVPNNCFTLSLCDSNSCKSNVGETTMWQHIDIDQDDEDHGVVPVTIEIMTVLWRWRSKAQDHHGHIMTHIWLHMMFIFYTSYFALIDGSIIRWSLTKFQDKYFRKAQCLAWHGLESGPLKILRTHVGWSSRLNILLLVIQDHIESIGKANTIKRGWGVA